MEKKRSIRMTSAGVLALGLLAAAMTPPVHAGQAFLSLDVNFKGVQMITDLTASSGAAAGQITLTWTAPSYSGAGSFIGYQIQVSTLANMNTNGAFINGGRPLSVFSPSTLPPPLPAGTASSMTVAGLASCTVYNFAIRGFDNSAPTAVGAWQRNAAKGFNLNNFVQTPCVTVNPIVAQVFLSSASVRFGTVGADGYVVEASTAQNFTGTIYSSASAAVAVAVSTLAPRNLDPNTTYYFRAGTLWGNATFYALSTPLSTSTLANPVAGARIFAVFSTSVTVNWTPLPSSPPDASSKTAEGYRLEASTAPDFSGAVFFSSNSDVAVSTLSVRGLSPLATYYFRVGSLNWDSAADFVFAGSTETTVFISTAMVPMPPLGFHAVDGAGAFTLRWLPVTSYDDGLPFVNPLSPTPQEMTGYEIYRATAVIRAPWVLIASAPVSATSWSGALSPTTYYYYVQAVSWVGRSMTSMIADDPADNLYRVAPDGWSYVRIPLEYAAPLLQTNPVRTYVIRASSNTQDLGTVGGRVMKSLDFDAYRAGYIGDSNMQMGGLCDFELHYQIAASSRVLASGFGGTFPVAPTPESMSVYWFNGSRWLQLYGTLDGLNQTMTVRTPYLGVYQLRTAERVQGFSADVAGMPHKYVTPNGDGKNDEAVWLFNNPGNSPVAGKIFDMRGAFVADMTPGPVPNSLLWDGKAGGRAVPGGVYLYQLSSEGLSFSGTVVVIK